MVPRGTAAKGCGARPTALQTITLCIKQDGDRSAGGWAFHCLRWRQPCYSPRLARAHLVGGKDSTTGWPTAGDGTAALDNPSRARQRTVVAGSLTSARLGTKRPSVASSIGSPILPDRFISSRPARDDVHVLRCTRRRVPSVSVRYPCHEGRTCSSPGERVNSPSERP